MDLNGITQTVATTGDAVTVRDVRDHLYISDDTFDGRLQGMIRAATDYCQRMTKRQFMPASYRLTLDRFPVDRLELPKAPLRSITTVGYTDTEGSSATVSSTVYTVVASDHIPGFVQPAFGEIWPSTRQEPNAVSVTFAAGYPGRAKIPGTIKQAMLLIVGHWYENRETVLVGSISKELEHTTMALLGVNDPGVYG